MSADVHSAKLLFEVAAQLLRDDEVLSLNVRRLILEHLAVNGYADVVTDLIKSAPGELDPSLSITFVGEYHC